MASIRGEYQPLQANELSVESRFTNLQRLLVMNSRRPLVIGMQAA
jgi:hypothetical protein